MLNFHEKRRHTRFETDCSMTFLVAGSERIYRARCVNLSGGGILFCAEQHIGRGKALEVHIPPGNKLIPTMTVFVEVTRSSAEKGDAYGIAARIKGIKGN
ncbi:MAG: PilZ domain-containing protein [Pseudomonadota bacterium]